MNASELMQEIYNIAKRLGDTRIFNNAFSFNNSEMQLLREIVMEAGKGKKIISSRLAERLGITRSAISQMVNKLESKNVVRRVADDKDRKIAYIELSDTAKEIYDGMKSKANLILAEVVEKMGEDKVAEFVKDANEFVSAFEQAIAHYSAEKGLFADKIK